MIKLTQKEFDLLSEVATFEVVDDKYLTKARNNGALAKLVEQGLVATRDSKNKLQVEVAILELGSKVYNNEVEHEIVTAHEVAENTADIPAQETAQGALDLAGADEETAEFVIEDGYDIPDGRNPRKPKEGVVVFPLDKMEIGQSFFVKAKAHETDAVKHCKNVRSKVSQTKKKLWGEKPTQQFKVGIVEGGCRVWRTA